MGDPDELLTFGNIANAIKALSDPGVSASERTKAESLLKKIKFGDTLTGMQRNPVEAQAAVDEKSRLIRAANLTHTDSEFYNAQRTFFLTFKLHSNQKYYISELIKKRFTDFFPLDLVRSEEQYLKMLDIGPGDGDVSLPFFWMFKNDNVDFVIHEPSFGMVARFLMNYMVQGQNFRRLGLYDNQGQKGFVCSSPGDINFGLASHVLYYMPNLEESVQAIYDSLAPGGVASVILTGKEGFLHRFRDKFSNYFMDKNLCGQDICDILEARSIPHEREELHSYVDITDCLCEMDPKDYTHLSIHGKNLICFMLRTDYGFTRNDDKADIVRFMLENSFASEGREEVTASMGCNDPHLTCGRGHDFYYKENRRFVRFTDDAIWIKKPGRYVPRPKDVKHRSLDAHGLEQDITVGEIKDLLRKPISDYITKDLKGMEVGLVEAYVSFLVMDYFLGEPYYYNIVWGDHPYDTDVFEKDGQKYVGAKAADKLRIVTEKTSLHNLRSTEFVDIRKLYASHPRGHPHCIEYLDDLLDTIQMHLPKESNEVLQQSGICFRQLVGALYNRFRHSEVISVDGFSNFHELLRQNQGNPYFDIDLSKFIQGYQTS